MEVFFELCVATKTIEINYSTIFSTTGKLNLVIKNGGAVMTGTFFDYVAQISSNIRLVKQ